MWFLILLLVTVPLIKSQIDLGKLSFDLTLPDDKLWEKFKKEFNTDYSVEEMAYRFTVFQSNLQKIRKNPTNLGITQFSAWTEQEFQSKMLTLKSPPQPNTNSSPNPLGNPISALFNLILQFFQSLTPSQTCRANTRPVMKGFDKNKILHEEFPGTAPVLNQGSCGSCYAFGYLSALYDTCVTYYGIKHDQLFSAQQIVDCSQSEGNDGCNGGMMNQVHNYIKKQGGMNYKDDYGPYTASVNDCKPKKDKYVLQDLGNYNDVPADENKFKEIMDQNIPMVIAVDATDWQHYSGGIMRKDKCCLKTLNHAVVLSGYGVENGTSYWLIKNSWAETWGDKGYIKLESGCNCYGMLEYGGYMDLNQSNKTTETPVTYETTEGGKPIQTE